MRFEVALPVWMRVTIAVCIVLAVLVVGAYVVRFGFTFSANQDVWGQFGDFVGGSLNPIFAMLAFFALLYTIALQSHELEATRDELQRSASAFEQQNIVLERQAFEATYFQLLRMYSELVDSLEIAVPKNLDSPPKSDDSTYRGRRALEKLNRVFLDEYLRRVARGDHIEEDKEARRVEYSKFYQDYGFALGHYFRTIYNIVRYVDESRLGKDQKYFYVRLLRAQLSRSELAFLFYNVTFGPGEEKFLPKVNAYGLLKHLEASSLKTRDFELFRAVKEKGVE